MNDDEPKRFSVRLSRIDLSEGRSVALGYSDDREWVLIRFINNQGSATKIRISKEAANALRELLARDPDHNISDTWVLLGSVFLNGDAPAEEANAS